MTKPRQNNLPKKLAHALTAGDCLQFGDSQLAATLEAALRESGEVQRATHGFHTYPAGMHPDAARRLLALGEGAVLDPFCGGGTVLVEAMLAGRNALGLDISPVAGMVSRIRTTLATPEEIATFLAKARALATARRPLGPGKYPTLMAERTLEGWYDPNTLHELAFLYANLENDPFLKACFSSILVKTSFRESDTSNHKVEKPSRAPGSTLGLFGQKAEELARRLTELAALTPAGTRVRVHREDAREYRAKKSEQGPEFGLLVTSPPYPGVYDYLPLQQLRCLWLGLEQDGPELGSRRAFRKGRGEAIQAWENDTEKWLKASMKALKPKSNIVILVGDGFAGGRPVEALPALHRASHRLGLTQLARVELDRTDSGLNLIRREYGIVLQCP